MSGNRTVGGYEVNDITKPSDGVQVAPVLIQSLLLGAVVGLLLGGGLGLRAELADRSFRSPGDIRRHLGLPVLGHIPPIRIDRAAGGQAGRGARSGPGRAPAAAIRPRPRPFAASARSCSSAHSNRDAPGDSDHQPQPRRREEHARREPRDRAGQLRTSASCWSIATSASRGFTAVRPVRTRMSGWPRWSRTRPTSAARSRAAKSRTCRCCRAARGRRTPRSCSPAPKFQEVLDDLRGELRLRHPRHAAGPGGLRPGRGRPAGRWRDPGLPHDHATRVPAAERAKEELAAVGGRLLGVVVNASTERDMGYGYGHGYHYDYQYTDTEAK